MAADAVETNSTVPALPAERGFARMQQAQESSSAGATSLPEIELAHATLCKTFASGRTRCYEWRLRQLYGLRKICTENQEDIIRAIGANTGRPRFEAFLSEIVPLIGEVDDAIANLKSWMKPEAVSHPLTQQPGRSVVMREPKGVVLNITPWNFPINLTLVGMVPILAAGNCCLVKPSEISSAPEELLANLIPRYLDPEAVMVVRGAVRETTALLKLRWDHILYTGNGAVARIVSRAAAEHLTPCTLELGGKSPTIVLPSANLEVAAKRIMSSKCLNAGQICIAPDYVIVHRDVEAKLVEEFRKTLTTWHGSDASKSPFYARIINKNHFNRVKGLIDSADGDIHQQGSMDEESKFIPPTLIRGVSKEAAVMKEEIFGPVLPILKVGSLDEIIETVNSGEKPLAMYIFGKEGPDIDRILSSTSSGGVCINDALFQVANPFLPFGGVGGSGHGRYHGKWGFDEFSHLRSVMYRATWLDPPIRYPPYTENNRKAMEKLLIGPLLPSAAKKALLAAGTVLGGAVALRLRSRL